MHKRELEQVQRAIRDARREIEGIEDSAEWYTAPQKLIDRLDLADKLVTQEILNDNPGV